MASEEGSGDPSQVQEIQRQLDLLTEENKQLIQSHEVSDPVCNLLRSRVFVRSSLYYNMHF